jgi:hypothetical protein
VKRPRPCRPQLVPSKQASTRVRSANINAAAAKGESAPVRTLVRGACSTSKENAFASEQSLNCVAVDSELLRQVGHSSTCLYCMTSWTISACGSRTWTRRTTTARPPDSAWRPVRLDRPAIVFRECDGIPVRTTRGLRLRHHTQMMRVAVSRTFEAGL